MKNLVGNILLSRFRVDTLLSAGASGSLYRGWDLKRNLPLSIKVYDSPVPYDPNALCFQQDDGTLQTLMHPNIAPFYGLFEDQGISFLVEKYIDGQVLAQITQTRNGQPFPPQDALIFLKTLGTSLEYAHGFGLVHCTVNPFNILIGRDGAVILTNFGFARHADRTMSPAGVLGLPAYTAPEQFRGAVVSPATDVYALGMLLFELTTGVHPFLRIPTSQATADQVTIERLRAAHLNQAPPDPCQLNTNLPDRIEETVSIALAKDPKQRYQSTQEMVEIICAIFGVQVQQVPDRLGSAATGSGAAQPPTQVLPGGAKWAKGAAAAAAIGTQVIPPASSGMGTQFVPPAPSGTGTQYVPPAPSGTGTQYIPPGPGTASDSYQSAAGAYPPSGQGPQGTQYIPGGQPASGQTWQGDLPVSGVPPAAPPLDYASENPAEKRKRPVWFWIVIGAVVLLVVVCGIGLFAGLPVLKDMFGTQTPTPTETVTFTPTMLPSTNTPVPAAELPTATLAPVVQPTIPPPPPPPPTQVPIPTVAPLPTQPLGTPTNNGQNGFKVTIHNNKPYEIYPLRDGKSMGGPIPPLKYIYYLNIPAGAHVFTFCLDPRLTNCPVSKPVVVDKDIDIFFP